MKKRKAKKKKLCPTEEEMKHRGVITNAYSLENEIKKNNKLNIM